MTSLEHIPQASEASNGLHSVGSLSISSSRYVLIVVSVSIDVGDRPGIKTYLHPQSEVVNCYPHPATC